MRRSCWSGCRRCSAPASVSSPRLASAAASRRRRRSSARTRSRPRPARTSPPRCAAKRTRHEPAGFIDLAAYKAAGGYALLRQCIGGELDVDVVDQDARGLGPARPRRRRLSGRAQVAHRARRARAAPDGGQHRRRRARHLQGPRLPRARPAPLPRRHADRRVGGRHRRASTSTCATSTTAAARCSKPSSPGCSAAPPFPACPQIELRRGAGAYICGEESAMIESIEGKRGMPRLGRRTSRRWACSAGRRSSTTSRRCYWVRDILEKGPEWFASHGRNGRKGLRSFSVSGRVQRPRRQAGAGRHHAPRADRRILRRHAGGAHALRLSAGRRLGRHPAGVASPTFRSTSTRCSRTAASSARRRSSCSRTSDTAVGAARNMMRFFARRVVRPVHALPRRHREGVAPDGERRTGTCRSSPTCRR